MSIQTAFAVAMATLYRTRGRVTFEYSVPLFSPTKGLSFIINLPLASFDSDNEPHALNEAKRAL